MPWINLVAGGPINWTQEDYEALGMDDDIRVTSELLVAMLLWKNGSRVEKLAIEKKYGYIWSVFNRLGLEPGW